MNKIEKLLRKAGAKDRWRLLEVMEALQNGRTRGLDIKKLASSSFYRARVGKYRVIFSKDAKTERIEIETIKLRNERTYQ